MIPDPTHLTPLLTQLTYCSTSFARLGMDFRGLLAPVFVDAVRLGITEELEDAASAWSTPLNAKDSRHTKPIQRPSQLMAASSALAQIAKPTPAQAQAILNSPVTVPPQILASFPHLAVYLNAILTALNGLRMLAPIELMEDIVSILDRTLAESGSALLRYLQEKPWQIPGRSLLPEETEREAEIADVAADMYFTILVPFVRKALVEGVYSSSFDDLQPTRSSELEDTIAEWKRSTAV